MGKWFMIGDTHGSFLSIENFLRRNQDFQFDGSDKMIVLGDFGGNYFCGQSPYKKADDKFKKKIAATPFTYYIVRGNHEERPSRMADMYPDKWDFVYEDEIEGWVYIEKKYPNIHYFSDAPSTYNIGGFKTLVMGGAYSVDKYYRLHTGMNWFPTEQMDELEMDIARKICEQNDWKMDLVLSHTCPICYEPTDLFLATIDQSMIEKDMERFFGEIEYQMDYKGWCWGHYHAFRDYPRTDGKRKLMLLDDVVDLHQFMTEDFVVTL